MSPRARDLVLALALLATVLAALDLAPRAGAPGARRPSLVAL